MAINNYFLLVHKDGLLSGASLPRWTEVNHETGYIRNSGGGIYQGKDNPREGHWDGLPPPWCIRIEHCTGNGPYHKQKKEVIWSRK